MSQFLHTKHNNEKKGSKGNRYTFKGGDSSKLFFLPSEKGLL